MKKTKIICTIGPASESKEMLTKLIRAGMNVMRLNFSHGDHQEHKARMDRLKELNLELDTNIGIMLDTKGPEIRTHEFEDGQVIIRPNQEIVIHMNEVLGTSEYFSVTYADLVNEVEIGDKILIDDGKLTLTVKQKNKDSLVTIAKSAAVLKNRRGVNIPNVKLNMPYVNEKDYGDIVFGCEQQVDYIAASFVRRKEDVLEIRKILDDHGGNHIQIIAKIENREGVDNADEILAVADGIMVARGDLGVEVDAQEVPLIQKSLIRHCNRAGKVVITATQMLESMISNPTPTRAEVSDVANAILDGTDVIMLSGESAAGKYPEEAVQTMNNIAITTEKILDYDVFRARAARTSQKTVSDAIAGAVTSITSQFDDLRAIVAYSSSGFTAKRISKSRPIVPILAITPTHQLARGLALHWGVEPIVVEDMVQFDLDSTDFASKVAMDSGLKKGDVYILTGGYPKGEGKTSYMRIVKIQK